MNPRRCTTAARALTVILGGWVVAWLAGFDSAVIGNSGAAAIVDPASSLSADAEPQATALGNAASDKAEEARTGADLTGSLQALPPETPPVRATTTSPPDMRPSD